MRDWPALHIALSDLQAGEIIQAFLLDFAVVAIDDNTPLCWSVFFQDAGARDRAASGLRERFPSIPVRPIDVPDEDWAARSQASLRAIRVGGIIVAPPWDVPSSGNRDPEPGTRRSPVASGSAAAPIVVVIQPSMGFGTGHHATTRLCLDALQQIDLHDRRVIDVGTGSGVLAIAASRLGARSVLGIDDDADAIAAARESLALNEGAHVTLAVMDVRSPGLGQFDVVVGNLTGALLIAEAGRLQSLAARSGDLVLSGYMDHEEDDVRRAFGGSAVDWSAQEDEWKCVRIRARP